MLWRVSKAKARKAPPAEFILPCQPTLADLAPRGDGWLHEVKHDGWRLVARKSGNRVRLWSRNASDYTAHFASIADAVRELPIETCTLDGEAVIFHEDGHCDFTALRSKGRAGDAVLIAFDLLEIAGADLRRHPLEARRKQLESLLADPLVSAPHIHVSEALEGDGREIYRHAAAVGCEGIISKRKGSLYRSGRSPDWLKIKSPTFVRR